MASAEIAALDVVDPTHKNVVMAITCNTSGDEHGSGWRSARSQLATLAASFAQLT